VPPYGNRVKAGGEWTTPRVARHSDDSELTKLPASFTVAGNNVQIFRQKATVSLGKKREKIPKGNYNNRNNDRNSDISFV